MEALQELLGHTGSGDMRTDFINAAREAMRRRERNFEAGGVVIAALRGLGMTYREIERETGISPRTAARWATPPPWLEEGNDD